MNTLTKDVLFVSNTEVNLTSNNNMVTECSFNLKGRLENNIALGVNRAIKHGFYPLVEVPYNENLNDYTAIAFYATSGSPSVWSNYYEFEGSIKEVVNYLSSMQEEINEYNSFIDADSNQHRRRMECFIEVYKKASK